MAVLLAIQGLPQGEILTLEKEATVLGRHPECDIVLDSGAVSRQHARITAAGDEFYVEDMQSRNGTLVNGRPIRRRQRLLRPGPHHVVRRCLAVPSTMAGTDGPASGRPPEGPWQTATADDGRRRAGRRALRR